MLQFDGFDFPLSDSLAIEPSYAGLQTKSLDYCFPLADFICGWRIVHYISTFTVGCTSQAVLVFVIRRGVCALVAFFDVGITRPCLPGRCLGLIYAHVYEGEDAIIEDDSNVRIGFNFYWCIHRTP